MSRTFAQDVEFMNEHVTVIQLGTGSGPGVAVVPEYQGRVMTSAFDAANGYGNGFLNYAVIEAGVTEQNINAFGGEDRFWLGPEGGQFSLFFDKSAEGDDGMGGFDFNDWQTPALIDTETYEVASQSDTEVVFTKDAVIENFSGTQFSIGIERRVKLLSNEDVESKLGVELPSTVQTVAYETENVLTNSGEEGWKRETGLLSIWILGMFKHSPTMRVIVPFEKGEGLGPEVKDDYFGKVPENRLTTMDGYHVFRADGQKRTKIGVGPGRAKDVLGSYDSGRRLLTIVKYTMPKGVTEYVNSSWQKVQEDPYGGDVVNSYNDGPQDDGSYLGPFYELETSSPALALEAGGSWTHRHATFHFTGTIEELQAIAMSVLGVDLDEVVSALE